MLLPAFTEAQGTYPTESGSTVLSKASKAIKPRPVASDGTCPDKAKAKGHRKLAWLATIRTCPNSVAVSFPSFKTYSPPRLSPLFLPRSVCIRRPLDPKHKKDFNLNSSTCKINFSQNIDSSSFHLLHRLHHDNRLTIDPQTLFTMRSSFALLAMAVSAVSAQSVKDYKSSLDMTIDPNTVDLATRCTC